MQMGFCGVRLRGLDIILFKSNVVWCIHDTCVKVIRTSRHCCAISLAPIHRPNTDLSSEQS